MNYVGTGAIGGIVGYYAGAQELLGIQSDENPTRQQPREQSPEEQDVENSDGLDTSGNGNTFSIEMAVGGRTRFSESVTLENIGVSQPDIVIGTRYSGDGACDRSAYEAEVSDMTVNDGSGTQDITNQVSLQEFSRNDRRNETYQNPASGSDNWSWSFKIEPNGPDFARPHDEESRYFMRCAAILHMRLTDYQGESWDRDSWENRPNTIDYILSRQQPADGNGNKGRGTLQHGIKIYRDGSEPADFVGGEAEVASNFERYDWYEEDTEWDITISRR